MFGVNKHGNLTMHKTATPAVDAIKTKAISEFMDKIYTDWQIVMGHNRAATKGATTDKNAHPFIEGDICLMHNGTLYSHKELGDQDVDSHAICHSLATVGYKETFEKINGAYALIWYNIAERKLYMARNNDRPLHMAVTPDNFYFASEMKMLDWILDRNGIKDYKLYFLEAFKTYVWDQTNLNKYEVMDTPKRVTPSVSTFFPKQSSMYLEHKADTTQQEKQKRLPNSRNAKATDTDLDNCIPHYNVGEEVEFANLGFTEHGKKRNPILEGYTQDGFDTDIICALPSTMETGLFNDVCAADHCTGIVQMIYIKSGKQTLHLRDPKALPDTPLTYTSKNGTQITQTMWDEYESHQCTHCGFRMAFDQKDIEEAHIVVDGGKITRVTCEVCVGDLTPWSAYGGFAYDY